MKLYAFNVEKLRKLNTISVYTRQKDKSKYINHILLERASEKQSGDTYKTRYDRVKRCQEHKINIKVSERVNVDVFAQNKRLCPQYSQTQFLISRFDSVVDFRNRKLSSLIDCSKAVPFNSKIFVSDSSLHHPTFSKPYSFVYEKKIGWGCLGAWPFVLREYVYVDALGRLNVYFTFPAPLHPFIYGFIGITGSNFTFPAPLHSSSNWRSGRSSVMSSVLALLCVFLVLAENSRRTTTAEQQEAVILTVVILDCDTASPCSPSHSHAGVLGKLNTMSAYTRQKANSNYINRIRLERAPQKQSSDTHKTPYDRVKRCRERKINTAKPNFFWAWVMGLYRDKPVLYPLHHKDNTYRSQQDCLSEFSKFGAKASCLLVSNILSPKEMVSPTSILQNVARVYLMTSPFQVHAKDVWVKSSVTVKREFRCSRISLALRDDEAFNALIRVALMVSLRLCLASGNYLQTGRKLTRVRHDIDDELELMTTTCVEQHDSRLKELEVKQLPMEHCTRLYNSWKAQYSVGMQVSSTSLALVLCSLSFELTDKGVSQPFFGFRHPASSGTMPTYEHPGVTRPGIEPGSPRDSPIHPSVLFQRSSVLTSTTLIGSQDLADVVVVVCVDVSLARGTSADCHCLHASEDITAARYLSSPSPFSTDHATLSI
ncbi:hypothetical protein PR048_016107 [Dryococelus australis]|uniref:Uncharacterized protein n=1 Tax=Dryococelus australis TaxID=614101 RepID=A0ABQ9HIT7_9NEOP|nr:hypothetical protein PR048_016107 [Dryococelus australis]